MRGVPRERADPASDVHRQRRGEVPHVAVVIGPGLGSQHQLFGRPSAPLGKRRWREDRLAVAPPRGKPVAQPRARSAAPAAMDPHADTGAQDHLAALEEAEEAGAVRLAPTEEGSGVDLFHVGWRQHPFSHDRSLNIQW